MAQVENALKEAALEDASMEVGLDPTTTPPGTGLPQTNNPGTAAVTASIKADPDTASDTNASMEVKKDRRKVLPNTFSREQEGGLEEWKPTLLQNKAKEFPDRTYDQLMQWSTNQRTIYGKVTAPGTKTGSAGSTLTERNRWIEEKWRFLPGHIVPVVTRTSAPKEQHIIDHASDDPVEGTSTPRPSTSQQHRSRQISSIDLTTPGGAEEGTDGNIIRSLNDTVRDGIQLLEEGRLRTNIVTQRAVDFCQVIMEEEITEDHWDFIWIMINGAIAFRNKKLMKARACEAQRPVVPQPRPPRFYHQYADRTYGMPRAMGAQPQFRAEQRHSSSPLMFTEQQPGRDSPLPFYGEGCAQTPSQEGTDYFTDSDF
ncbi:uncharacterized protein LOC129710553 [Leucoraja erinacea]|uniref:uncharacterized protein LOC129710553 n=1 Tax=Leucoraja erinaceus TaxID=7782 RepID=UPI002455CDF7|nr:uncharacterized protein LOC129710553 [Leucoraja erinacea]